MSWNHFNIYLVLMFAFVLAVLAGVNYCIDPYGIFNTNDSPLTRFSNQRFMKTQHLIENDAYDVLLMGSSRLGVVNPKTIEDVFLGQRVYNSTFFMAKPPELHSLLRFLKKKRKLPKTIVLGLDLYAFDKTHRAPSTPQYLMHPKTDLSNPILFYMKALFGYSFSGLVTRNPFGESKRIITFDLDTGAYSRPPGKDEEEYYEYESAYMDTNNPVQELWGNSLFDEVSDLENFILSHDIQLFIHTNPINMKRINIYPASDQHFVMNRLESSLNTKICHFLLNERIMVTTRYWDDLSHFKPVVAEGLIRSSVTGDSFEYP